MLAALIFLNGDLKEGPAVDIALERASAVPHLIVAVDGGLRHVFRLGLIPNVLIGDMDSVTPEEMTRAQHSGAEILKYPTHKDETDLELALHLAVARGCSPIYLVSAIGSRLDQSLSNIHLLTLPNLHNRTVQIVADAQVSWVARPDETIIRGAIGDTLSLIPLSAEVKNITTEGLEYPLKGESLYLGPARGVSNTLTHELARVRFSEGLLFIVHTYGKAE